MLHQLQIETVHTLIELATALDEAHNLIPPDSGFDVLRQSQEPWAKILYPLRRGMTKLINGLTRPEKAELLALMWSGRDGTPFKDYMGQAYEQADDTTGSYVTEKAPLAEYLRTGLKQLGLPTP